MNGFEWVGFFISALSVLFLVGKAIYDAVQNEKNPSKYKAQQEEAERRFKAFLRGESPSPTIDRVLREVMEEDEEDEEDEAPKKRSPARKPTAFAAVMSKETIPPANIPTSKHVPSIAIRENSRAKKLLLQENTPKNMVILSEIFGKPKGLR